MTQSALIAAAVVGIILASDVMAVPPGKSIEWDTPKGKVIFDGKPHADKGMKCPDCHTKIFKMKKGTAEMKMQDINAGKFCGECHNGVKAFKTNDEANCARCHHPS